MSETPESTSYTADDTRIRDDALEARRLPAAATPMHGAGGLFVVTLLSAVDGTLVMLGASGRLSSFGGALVVGLTVIAGAGSWVAAREVFGGRTLRLADRLVLLLLGILTVAATAAATWLGATLGQALTLHVMPKAAGVILLLVGAEVAGLRLPRVAGAPLPVLALAAAGTLEVAIQWSP